MLDMTCVFWKLVFQTLDQPGFKGYTLFKYKIYINDINNNIIDNIIRGLGVRGFGESDDHILYASLSDITGLPIRSFTKL
jgi:hypothetical protein